MTKLYAEIAKMEAQDDGTVKVWGYASSETVDSDGETITAQAMKAAIPDYMKFGAVREMHGKSAAGTAIEIKVEDDGRTFFGAHIVDPTAVLKVKSGVYKGFSIGGSVTQRDELNKSIISGIKLSEISLVDRPANPEAVFTMIKMDDADKAEKGDEETEKADEEDGAEDKPTDKENDKDDEGKDGETEKAELTAAEIALLKTMLAKADRGGKQDDEQKPETVEKSMYSVKSLADIIQSLKWLIDDMEWDGKQDEELVVQIKSSAKSLADSLVAMTAKEAEAIAEKADTADDLNKAAETDKLAKMESALAKAEAEIAELKKQAAPPKGVTKAVSKAEDNGGSDDVLKGFTPILQNDGSLNEAATLIKAVQTKRL